MKQLPKNFAIYYNAENPLWRGFINWLNKTHKAGYNGHSGGCYYGYRSVGEGTGKVFCDGFMRYPEVEVITLEEWDEVINPKTLFDLSNTKIRVNSPEESKLIQEKAFQLGWKWTAPNKLDYLDKPFLYFSGSKWIYYGEICSIFKSDSRKEITLKDLGIEIKPKLQPMNYKITPEQAQSIINIACSTWKAKLATLWANKIVLGQEIDVDASFYKEMRKACTEQQHRLFDKIFGPEEKSFSSNDLKEGEAMIVKEGGFNSHLVLKAYNVLVSLTDPNLTWGLNADFKGRKVQLNPITYKEI